MKEVKNAIDKKLTFSVHFGGRESMSPMSVVYTCNVMINPTLTRVKSSVIGMRQDYHWLY